MNTKSLKQVILIATAAVFGGCSSAKTSKSPNNGTSMRSGAGLPNNTNNTSATNASTDASEMPIVEDKGNYPFPINKNSRLSALPLPFDGKDWSQPDPVTGAAIAAFYQAGGTYSTACSNGMIKLFIIEDSTLITQTVFFAETNCSSGIPSSTLAKIVKGQDITRNGNSFIFSGLVMDVILSPKTSSAAADFAAASMCGIPEWFANTNISIAGKTCEGTVQPNSGSAATAQITVNENSITLGNGTTFTKQPQTLAITGGSKISASTSMLALSTVALMNNNQPFCTGTLVSDTFAVTAAHCVEFAHSLPKDNLYVGLGESLAKKIKVQSLIKHESYTDQNLDKNFTPLANYDLGLVKLVSQVPKPYRPVAILPATENFSVNEKVYIAGYGVDEKGIQGILKASHSLFAEESAVAVNFKTVSSLTQSTCNGDSGGPAFVVRGDYYYLVGATSYGPSGFYCREGDSFFVDLRKAASWLESRMN